MAALGWVFIAICSLATCVGIVYTFAWAVKYPEKAFLRGLAIVACFFVTASFLDPEQNPDWHLSPEDRVDRHIVRIVIVVSLWVALFGFWGRRHIAGVFRYGYRVLKDRRSRKASALAREAYEQKSAEEAVVRAQNEERAAEQAAAERRIQEAKEAERPERERREAEDRKRQSIERAFADHDEANKAASKLPEQEATILKAKLKIALKKKLDGIFGVDSIQIDEAPSQRTVDERFHEALREYESSAAMLKKLPIDEQDRQALEEELARKLRVKYATITGLMPDE